ncbi:hypothetical protein [Jeotgalibacillus sp. R-1-5s-1]|uniref:hypothetical protein n=1 Tax=Jeotgalibacillus sp. R-1-5s-1 TaxID=2555897 RepID=UPI0010695F35|nr:hypothetical protein [Jeotgalibacillus sp. R-1-5s-1]TFE00864.1 hypothetical protein E2491_04975 [Jeotgalibacillus sp. R-1-5s-1]
MSLQMFFRSTPSDDVVDQNRNMLSRSARFQPYFQDHSEKVEKDDAVRCVIGKANPDRAMRDEKYAERLERKLIKALK